MPARDEVWLYRPPEVLRLLCYGDFRIHSEYRGMREHLIGDPLARERE